MKETKFKNVDISVFKIYVSTSLVEHVLLLFSLQWMMSWQLWKPNVKCITIKQGMMQQLLTDKIRLK